MISWLGRFWRRLLGRSTEASPAPHTLVMRVQALEAHQEQRMLRVAEEALRRGHPDQAVIAYRKAAERFQAMGQLLKQAAVLQHLVRLRPDDLGPLRELIEVYDDMGRLQEAAVTRLRLAAALRQRGEAPEADQLERRARAQAFSLGGDEDDPGLDDPGATPEMPGDPVPLLHHAAASDLRLDEPPTRAPVETEPAPVPDTARFDPEVPRSLNQATPIDEDFDPGTDDTKSLPALPSPPADGPTPPPAPAPTRGRSGPSAAEARPRRPRAAPIAPSVRRDSLAAAAAKRASDDPRAAPGAPGTTADVELAQLIEMFDAATGDPPGDLATVAGHEVDGAADPFESGPASPGHATTSAELDVDVDALFGPDRAEALERTSADLLIPPDLDGDAVAPPSAATADTSAELEIARAVDVDRSGAGGSPSADDSYEQAIFRPSAHPAMVLAAVGHGEPPARARADDLTLAVARADLGLDSEDTDASPMPRRPAGAEASVMDDRTPRPPSGPDLASPDETRAYNAEEIEGLRDFLNDQR